MRLGGIRPVGEPIERALVEPQLPTWMESYDSWLLGSGTEALALALVLVRRAHANGDRYVTIPAYCCPDIVSAILFAGLKPRILDVRKDSPFVDYSKIRDSELCDTVAVVVPHFLGIDDDIGTINQRFSDTAIDIIEDSAQFIPGQMGQRPSSDLVILSFGRGKPVSALGGGVLLTRGDWSQEISKILKNLDGNLNVKRDHFLNIRRIIHNICLEPFPFGLLSRIPFLGIGEVRQKRIEKLSFLSRERGRLIYTGLSRWDYKQSQSQLIYQERLGNQKGITFVSGISYVRRKLLRFPVLVPSLELRNQIFSELDGLGLGASKLYRSTIVKILDESIDGQEKFPNAEEFADRLITLPVHMDVSQKSAREITGVFERRLK